MKSTCLFLIAFLAWASLVAQQVFTGPPERSGIEGVVVKSGSSQPLKKARVTLQPIGGGRQGVSVVTDSNGHFFLSNLEPGRYRLSVQRNGYVTDGRMKQIGGPVASLVVLRPGEQLRSIRLPMVLAPVIVGRIYDEDGEGVPGVRVQALRSSYANGFRRLIPLREALSNDIGEFRLSALPPGRYYVRGSYSGGPPGSEEPAAAPGARSTAAPAAEDAYAPTYYPGTSDPGRASPIQLRAGDEVRGIDFPLEGTRTLRVRGSVFNAVIGQSARGVAVSLFPRPEGGVAVAGSQTTITDTQGVFEFRGVTPGAYTVSAMWRQGDKTYSARQRRNVGFSDMEGVNLVIASGLQLKGHFRVEGNSIPNLPALRVRLEPRDELRALRFDASVESDGTFLLGNLSEGMYDISLVGAPKNLYIGSAHFGGDEVLESGLRVERGMVSASLELVLRADGGRVDGVVFDGGHKPVEGAVAVAVPSPPRRARNSLFQIAVTDPNGRFNFSGLVPGEYKLFAWEDVDPEAYEDPDFLRSFENWGKPIQVQGSGRQTVELRALSTQGQRP